MSYVCPSDKALDDLPLMLCYWIMGKLNSIHLLDVLFKDFGYAVGSNSYTSLISGISTVAA